MKILRKDENGIEIEPPRVATQTPMADAIDERNRLVRKNAEEEKRQCSPVYGTDYPISGGWGYSQSEACIIEMKGKMSDRTLLLSERDGYSVENLFIERRIYEEIITHPEPETPDLYGLRWKVGNQSLHRAGDQLFDKISVTVSGYLRNDFEELRKDWEAHRGYADDETGRINHQKMAMSRRIFYNATYWFNVTSFV